VTRHRARPEVGRGGRGCLSWNIEEVGTDCMVCTDERSSQEIYNSPVLNVTRASVLAFVVAVRKLHTLCISSERSNLKV
jgi:hypothetical protein